MRNHKNCGSSAKKNDCGTPENVDLQGKFTSVFHDFSASLVFQRDMAQGYSGWGKKFPESENSRWQAREKNATCSEVLIQSRRESVRSKA